MIDIPAIQFFVHYFLHLIFPLAIAWLFFRKQWKKAYLIMLLTMLVDLDHLMATPIYDKGRCSIQYHPFHSYWIFPIYIILMFFNRPWKWIGMGCTFHMITDLLDCIFTYHFAENCMMDFPVSPLLSWINDHLF